MRSEANPCIWPRLARAPGLPQVALSVGLSPLPQGSSPGANARQSITIPRAVRVALSALRAQWKCAIGQGKAVVSSQAGPDASVRHFGRGSVDGIDTADQGIGLGVSCRG